MEGELRCVILGLVPMKIIGENVNCLTPQNALLHRGLIQTKKRVVKTMMTTLQQTDLYMRARDFFGDEHQLKKCAEECCELATAIMRLVNGCDGHSETECIDNVMEEVVDVDIMINQLWGIFSLVRTSSGQTLKEIAEYKLQRLKTRIEEGEHAKTRTFRSDNQ